MDAEANATVVPTQEEGSNSEFTVHTKHTCDKCFQRPIIGKRYGSSVNSNYDLCSRCFVAYTGPEIGLSEAKVLARDNKHSREFVLKLKIDEGGDVQVRRIKVSEVWDTTCLSFEKVMAVASGFTVTDDKADDAGLDAFIAKAKATYIDEDGDEITMTSNRELEDAFLQVLKKFPVHKPFIIRVTIPEDKPANARAACRKGAAAGMPKRVHLRKVEPRKKPFSVSMDESPKSKTTLRVTPQKFEKDFFVHARHTCDGCSRSPIIGVRYHATKIPDFDLCGNCFKKYEGEKSDFQPEIHPRDRRMQQRWLKKQLSDSAKSSSNIAAEWSKASGNLADFLKKVQEAGGNIESATVIQSPPCQGYSTCTSAPKTCEELNADKEDAGDEKAPISVDKATEEDSKPLAEVEEPFKEENEAGVENPTVESAPGSAAASHDESFQSDADGIGSIAEAIGQTLDICVAAIEDAMADEMEKGDAAAGGNGANSQKSSVSKAAIEDDVAAAAVVAADAFSVASSMVSSMTDVLRKMEEAEKVDGDDEAQAVVSQFNTGADNAASTTVPSAATGATILKSEDGIDEKNDSDILKAEDSSEDEWSVVDDNKKDEER